MRQEPVAELEERFGDAVAQVAKNALAGFDGLGAPAFDDATARLAVGCRKAAGVCREPKRGEIRIELLRKDQVEVRLDVRRTGHAGVVPEQAQLGPVGDDSPQARIVGVEVLLHYGMGSLAPAILGERAARTVEVMAIMG
ncbi:MAG: hypothetical protein OXG82_08930 [Gammaproteobacteria bacterium]|nr:hypothetical protein [Gammaproteobacteria bacterium]